MMRPTVLGGLAAGTEEVLALTSCLNQRASLWSKSSSFPSGVQISSWATSYSSCYPRLFWSHTSIAPMRPSCVSSSHLPCGYSELTACLSLVWLRPSKQIRAPLYSIKQKRQRRWIVGASILVTCVYLHPHRLSNTAVSTWRSWPSSLSSLPHVSI